MLCYSCPCELLTFAANGTDSCSFVLVLCAVDLRSRYDWQTVLTLALLFLSCAQLTYARDSTIDTSLGRRNLLDDHTSKYGRCGVCFCVYRVPSCYP